MPYYDYGEIFVLNINQKIFDKMQRLQNRALLICLAEGGRSNVNDMQSTYLSTT